MKHSVQTPELVVDNAPKPLPSVLSVPVPADLLAPLPPRKWAVTSIKSRGGMPPLRFAK